MLYALYLAIMLGGSRKKYERLFEEQLSPPLYAAPWWLDTTCGPNGWEVNSPGQFTENGGALIPYYRKKIKGLSAILNPPLTQWLPVLQIASEKISIIDFIQSLPSRSILDVCFHPNDSFINAGVDIPVNFKYSYILRTSENPDGNRSKYNEGLRRNLREAEINYSIQETDEVDIFIKLYESTYRQRNMKPPSWIQSLIPRLYQELKKHDTGKLEFAIYRGEPIAGTLTAWDNATSFYLLGGRKEGDSGTSAHALLLDNAIRFAALGKRQFDFEGSMHPGIANFFQSFGASPEAYWQIRKFTGVGKLWSLLQN